MAEDNRVSRRIDEALARRYVQPVRVCGCCAPVRIPYKGGLAHIEPDPEGDKVVYALVRKFKMEPYDEYLKGVIIRAKGPMKQWPVNFKRKERKKWHS